MSNCKFIYQLQPWRSSASHLRTIHERFPHFILHILVVRPNFLSTVHRIVVPLRCLKPQPARKAGGHKMLIVNC